MILLAINFGETGQIMTFNKMALMKKALLIVATSFLLYNIYQSIITTIFVSHFPLIVTQLPNFIKSSQPALQLTLFLLQELAASVGSYLRLIGAIFAFSSAFLIFKKDVQYLQNFRRALLFESLYFLLLIPAGINHIVGSIITSSVLLNFYTGASFLLQAALIFPPLFILSRKLKEPPDIPSTLKWAGVAASLYVLGIWIKHALMWVYALSPLTTQQTGLNGIIGFVNSMLTLLVAAILAAFAWLRFRQNKKLNTRLLGTALILVGVYFVIYAAVSVGVSTYLAFLTLTEFWMITLPILGIAVLFDSKKKC
jgi:hypothetical protein